MQLLRHTTGVKRQCGTRTNIFIARQHGVVQDGQPELDVYDHIDLHCGRKSRSVVQLRPPRVRGAAGRQGARRLYACVSQLSAGHRIRAATQSSVQRLVFRGAIVRGYNLIWVEKMSVSQQSQLDGSTNFTSR